MSDGPRRLVVVLASAGARGAAPPGVDPDAFARACLADTYEVAADLIGVDAAICGPEAVADLLWPGSRRYAPTALDGVVAACTPDADELVVVPADVPDLPGLVLAKIFKVLHRSHIAVAPARGGEGCAALGFRLPAAGWLPLTDLDLDVDPRSRLTTLAPERARVAVTPDWHRLREPADVHRLDPRLEGWDETRALLSAGARGRP